VQLSARLKSKYSWLRRKLTEVQLAKIQAMEAEKQREEAEKVRNRAREKEDHEIKMLEMKAQAVQDGNPDDATGTKIFSHTKFPIFDEQKDNLDQYLERFERYVTILKYPKDKWALQLSTQLTGKALAVCTQLTPEDALDYHILKSALLQRYQMTEDGYRHKFRTSRPERSETPRQFQARLNSYLENWIHLSGVEKTYKNAIDLFMREQFIVCCSKDLSVFLRERKCNTIEDLVNSAENYVDAHGLSSFSFNRQHINQ
jgi:hypothetical protein